MVFVATGIHSTTGFGQGVLASPNTPLTDKGVCERSTYIIWKIETEQNSFKERFIVGASAWRIPALPRAAFPP